MLDADEDPLSLPGPRLQPSNLEGHLAPEAHLRAFQPGARLLFAFEDPDRHPEKTGDAVEALGLDRAERAALPAALQRAGRDAKEVGHLLRPDLKALLHGADQRGWEALVDRFEEAGQLGTLKIFQRLVDFSPG